MLFGIEVQQKTRIRQVADMNGLVAFWDFHHSRENTWISYYDREIVDRSFPLHLRRIGDVKSYSSDGWPYTDVDSQLLFDQDGPFGRAVRFNKGFIYGAVERANFAGTLLDLHGKQAFTLIAWVKFVGERHMVAGIWDEGGWDKYEGRRQVALFAGLFRQKGVIAHISATGAASYPQSDIPGSQYARVRAVDGQAFNNNQWVAMGMTYDPEKDEVVAYLNGETTPLKLTDPVARDVFEYTDEQVANPLSFTFPIFSPRCFVLKYNGHSYQGDEVKEHRLHVDLDGGSLTYEQECSTANHGKTYRVFFDIKRRGQSILAKTIEMKGIHGLQTMIPADTQVMDHDEVWTKLETLEEGSWKQIGTPVNRTIRQGAPFTFGRALGLGSEDLDHGSQLYMDGVAVFNRVLKKEELKKLSFNLR